MGQSTPATQTVTNRTEVDPLTQQWRSAIFNQGQNLMAQGPAPYYPGSTVTPYAQQTMQGLDMLQQNAQQGAVGLPQAYDAQMRAMSGFNPGMGTAMQAANGGMRNPYQHMMFGAANQNTAGQIAPMLGAATGANPYTDMLAQAGQQGAATAMAPMITAGTGQNGYAQQIAGAGGQSAASGVQPYLDHAMSQGAGPYAAQIAQAGQRPTTMGVDTLNAFTDVQNNPYLDQLWDSGRAKVTDAVNAQFAGAGRTGPNAAFGQGLGNALGDLYANIYAPAYENAQNRRMQAAGQLAGIDQGNRAAQMSGYESAAGLGLQDASLGLQGAGLYGDLLGSDYNRNLQAQTSAGNLAESGYGRALQGAGMYGDTLTADLNRGLQGYGMAGDLAESGFGRQMQGADLMGNLLTSDANRRYQGASDLAGIAEAGFGRQLQGAQLAGDMWSQGNTDAARAAALLPGLYQYGAMPGESMVGVGGAHEALAQQYLDADIARYNYGQNAQWDQLQRYANLMNGMPDFSAQTQSTTGGQGQNRAMGALGGAASGASIGSMFGPWGTGIGAVLGAFGGLG